LKEITFDDLIKLVDYIPIDSNIPSNGKFMKGTTVDSKFYFQSIDHQASFRDIVSIANAFLKDSTARIYAIKSLMDRRGQLREIGCSYPAEYLLFDFCLAALEGDFLDAKLYLAHSYHLLRLDHSFNLLLSVIVNEPLMRYKEVREFVTLLAKAIKPGNSETYLDTYGQEYKRRYEIYQEELKKIHNPTGSSSKV
jgi:hypothetical protein